MDNFEKDAEVAAMGYFAKCRKRYLKARSTV